MEEAGNPTVAAFVRAAYALSLRWAREKVHELEWTEFDEPLAVAAMSADADFADARSLAATVLGRLARLWRGGAPPEPCPV